MIRLAAAGDLHCRVDGIGRFSPWLSRLDREADVLLLAGDLTNLGEPAEAQVLASELAGLSIPILAVLGNHDVHTDHEPEVRAILEDAGVVVLEKEATVIEVRGETLGVVGAKGFGGGFGASCISPFGESAIKLFLQDTFACAEAIAGALSSFDTDFRVVLLHYSPIPETLKGESLGIYPFLGSSILGEPIDVHGADLVLHGHAHLGTEHGVTPGGIPVRNCSIPVLHQPYALYELKQPVAV
jgi:Icc-related predicted phosphoesterase